MTRLQFSQVVSVLIWHIAVRADALDVTIRQEHRLLSLSYSCLMVRLLMYLAVFKRS
jgi:hypothetical protein